MNQLLIASLLLAFAGVASAQANVDEPEESGNRRSAPKAQPDDRFCIQQTGSRITAARHARGRSDEKECNGQGGRVYSRDDINRTGSTDMADALRRLDPSIR